MGWIWNKMKETDDYVVTSEGRIEVNVPKLLKDPRVHEIARQAHEIVRRERDSAAGTSMPVNSEMRRIR